MVTDHQSPGQELLNSLTHALGTLLSVAGTVMLIVGAAHLGDPWKIVAFSVFGASMILLYSASTLYHSVRRPRLKQIFKTIDHCAIFILIAGTYTPFTLVSLRGPIGWTLLGVIWGLALTGVILKIVYGNRYKAIRVSIYLAMGWLIVIAVPSLASNLNSTALTFTILGGLVYTFGVLFYLADRRPYMHAIWHLFVIGGTASHFIAIYHGILPA
ncbi:MAG: hemolysin III family protein [Opitutales bacterium]|nr:hemolysin III family protein [Opitutales bacterium]